MEKSISSITKEMEKEFMFILLGKLLEIYTLEIGETIFWSQELIFLKMVNHIKELLKMVSKVGVNIGITMEMYIKVNGEMI